jgi:Domain of unknown function (DUF4326)
MNLEPEIISRPVTSSNEIESVLTEFRIYLSNQPGLLKQIHELKDKTLGCWCKPEPCHGDVLIELADK